MTQANPFTKTQMAIIVLLGVEDKYGKKYAPIPGKTHLVKELFAICQKELGKKLLPDLNFEPDNYGPYDETIYAALDTLRDGGYVSFDDSSRSIKIKLTEKGQNAADGLWDRLKDDVKTMFVYTKKNFNHLTSEQLLEKIYAAYPYMTVNSISKIADKYRPIED